MATTEDVARLAALARIDIPEGDRERIAAEFESILTYIGQLDELSIPTDTTQRIPAVHNVFRPDTNAYEPGSWTKKIVNLFPAKVGNSLSVKKIISHE